MAQIPSDMNLFQMLSASGIASQKATAVDQLAAVLRNNQQDFPEGRAYNAGIDWQRRFERSLQREIPEWTPIAGARCISDYIISETFILDYLEKTKPVGYTPPADSPSSKEIDTWQDFWHAYNDCITKQKGTFSGKYFFKPGSVTEAFFLGNLPKFTQIQGGQAWNIIWLWSCLGARARFYMPYPTDSLKKYTDSFRTHVKGLNGLDLIDFEPENSTAAPGIKAGAATLRGSNRLVDAAPGVRQNGTANRSPSPTGASVVLTGNGQRLIIQFSGFRVFPTAPASGEGMPVGPLPRKDKMPWDQVEYWYCGSLLATVDLTGNDKDDTWPQIPLFHASWIADRKLKIILADPDSLEKKFRNQGDFAVIGGLDALFGSDWLKKSPSLQPHMDAIAREQLRALTRAGVRIGVELSGSPNHEFFEFLRQMCGEGVIVTVGINGLDELPKLMVEDSLKNQLNDLWLDPGQFSKELSAEINSTEVGPHFEYVTRLRSVRLAKALGVSTLYVHTNTLDLIFRRHADPGALLNAQLADMMGKGLVIVSLLKRAFKDHWLQEMTERMPLAINPAAMARLGQFASDFACFEGEPAAFERLLNQGYWLARPEEYSVAVVPVMWPDVSGAKPGVKLPPGLVTSGAGDMSFGAIFWLGGL